MKSFNLKIFSERLKELRIEKKLTTKNLGEMINISDIAISRWERGLRVPNIESLYKLAVFFDVSTDYLVGLEDQNMKEIDLSIFSERLKDFRTEKNLSTVQLAKKLE